MADVLITEEAQQQFHALPKIIRTRLEKLLLRLEQWPDVSGVKALRGDLAGRYRMRTGDYRVQFFVQPRDPEDPKETYVVTIEKVGHRDGFYNG
jgi:mRNA-degrading endonuclease RelE of RelBE toxin-antitoxin system